VRHLARLDRASAAALAGYGVVGFAFFGLRLLPHPGRSFIGNPADPEIFIWSFAWWPHAIVHGMNPFVSHVIWAPGGDDIAWRTTTPALALAFAPLTWIVGPVATYNVVTVLMPVLAAWTAFLLCRHVTQRIWPSLAGGYVFGFSSYMIGQLDSHLHMSSVFLLPLVALVVLRYVEGMLDGRGLVIRLGPILAAELALSFEVSFVLALALAVALVLAYLLVPAARARLLPSVPWIVAAYALAAVIVSPLAYYALTNFTRESINNPNGFTLDLLNLVVPTHRFAVGGEWGKNVAAHFPGNDTERDGYLGLPLVVLFVWFAIRRRRLPGSRFLVLATLAAVFVSFGNFFKVYGHRLSTLPWEHVGYRPLFNNVLPSRLMLLAFLALAVVVAVWAASEGGLPSVVLPTLVVVSLLPNLSLGFWRTHAPVPAFFTSGAVQRCLPPGRNVLILPQAKHGSGMLYQAVNGFGFRMADGYLAPDPPASFITSPAVARVAYGEIDARDLQAFAREKDVGAVLVRDGESATWQRALRPLAPPQRVDGMLVYRFDRRATDC
jgi:hypothetical protein